MLLWKQRQRSKDGREILGRLVHLERKVRILCKRHLCSCCCCGGGGGRRRPNIDDDETLPLPRFVLHRT